MRTAVIALLAISSTVSCHDLCAKPIFIQAEDFTCDGTTWVTRKQTGPYAPDSGLRHLAGAGGQQGVAWLDVDIPEEGHYVVWVRHTVMRDGGRGPFAVSLKQGDRLLGTGTFDEAAPDKNPQRIHRYDFNHFETDLPVGKVRVEITKLPPFTCSGWTRYVDCLVLTTDPEYVPKATDFQPKIWLRVTLGQSVENPVYIHCFCDHYRAPWYKHFSLSKDGYEERVSPRRGKEAFLSAGEQTPWCDITSAIHEDRGARLELRLAEKYSYTEWVPACDAVFQFATAPHDSAIVKRFERRGAGAGLAIVTPGVLTKETASALRCDQEYFEDSRTFAAMLPDVPFGKRPGAFPFFLTGNLRPQLFAPEIRVGEFRIISSLGINGLHGPLDSPLESLGFRFTRAATKSWYMKNGCYLQPECEKIRTRISAAAAEWKDKPPTIVVFMDEPTAKPLAHAVSCSVCKDQFVTWLKNELHVPLDDLQRQSWDAVLPVTEEARDDAPALYYYSQRFRSKALADFLRLQTNEIDSAFAGPPPATVNFSDGAIFRANMFLQGVDYFHVFRTRALSMTWSEDWANIASTYQCAGYNADLLRAARKTHGQPMGMYLITSSGRTPLDVKLKAYSSIGRGVRTLQSYAYGIPYASHNRGWYMNKDMCIAVKQLTHEIGGAEDLLLQATRIPSEVAFLYATTSDIWTLNDNELYGHERMHTYLALMHAQVPVDFLSEKDVIDGQLRPYKALYVFGPNLQPEAVPPIVEWTKGGGTLYLAAGAATADQYNRSARPLDRALTLSRGSVDTLQKYTAPGRHLRGLTPHGHVALDHGTADILGVRQTLDAQATLGASVLAWSDDRTPLAIRCQRGEGTVFATGFMPGISYIRKALLERDTEEARERNPGSDLGIPGMDSHTKLAPHEQSYNPTAYPEGERNFLLLPIQQAKLTRPIVLSHPLVEAFYLEGPRGAVITLANYGMHPIENLRATIRAGRSVAKVESVRHGTLSSQVTTEGITTELPLSDTDMMKLYWQESR